MESLRIFLSTFIKALTISTIFILCFCSLPQSKYADKKYLHEVVLLDNSLSEDDIPLVVEALRSWECSTRGIVQFTIIKYPTQYDLQYITDLDHTVIIENVPRTDYRITEQDVGMPPGLHVIGLFTRSGSSIPEILLTKEMLSGDRQYVLLAEHEIGHSIGLDHIEHPTGNVYPVMYPSPGTSDGITNEDLLQLAQIYGLNLRDMSPCQ